MTDITALRELLRRSVLTLAAVPDSDLRYRIGPRSTWPEFVRHARDAYGYAPPRFRNFQPTRQDLTVYLEALSWLDWYRRTYGAETVRVFIGWCFGAAMWELQERTSTNRRKPCSPRTVHDRRDAMILAIADQFPDATRKLIDNFAELQKFAATDIEDDELSSDLRNFPKPPWNWRSPGASLPSGKGQQEAHLLLEKRLNRNRLRAKTRI